MSLLYARRSNIPLPAGIVLVSPWLDLTLKYTQYSPAMATDFLITFSKDNPWLVEQLLPPDIEPSDPRVSPLFDELNGLPPQLVFAGTAEVLSPDATEWARKSREAGNSVEYTFMKGQMHT
jgi:acetyl esterase/lipase